MAYRRRRRAWRSWLSGVIRRYMQGFLYLAFGIAITTGVAYLVGLAPSVDLVLGDTAVISTTTILQFILFAFGIVFVLRGIRFFIRNF
jgi:small neutral amino acid transporter SnatA (MarC family)